VSKKLVAYFSASGITKKVAEKLAKAANADIFEIVPEVPYTEADLDWRDQNSRSSIEMKDQSFRPAMAKSELDISGYDTVFVGFPIWWYVAPTIINTFLESHDFAGKTIVVFATSGSSDFGGTVDALKPSCPGAAIIQGKRFAMNAEVSEEELKHWIENL